MEGSQNEDEMIVAAEFEGLEGMELGLQEFITAFRRSPQLVRKMAISTGLHETDFASLQDSDLETLFAGMDTDFSGTISFEEFVKGIVQIRDEITAAKTEAEANEEDDALDQAYIDACEAFQNANFQYRGELDLPTFIEALEDPWIVEKVAMATHLPTSFFENPSYDWLKSLFQQIDTDASGTVSFQEWVDALVRIRRDVYMQEKIQEEAALEEVMKYAEEALDEGDEDWSGEFDLREFVNAFENNPRFVRKVSLATNIPASDFQHLGYQALENLFQTLDTDFSGSISFEEFVKGLLQIRLEGERANREQEAVEEEAVLEDAAFEAAEAFADSSFGIEGELDLAAFMEALVDPIMVSRVANATGLPVEFFASLDSDRMVELFQEIDTDCSGSISFHEWVSALVDIRKATYAQEKIEEQQTVEEVIQLAEDALDEADEDWSGEFEFDEFINAFRSNPRFLRKVSLATKVPVEEFKALEDEDLASLFDSLDTDYSGTVSFEEFTNGLLEIRRAQQGQEQDEEAIEEANAMDNAAADAINAFEDIEMLNSEFSGELSLDTFTKALQDPTVVEKVSAATKLPIEFFQALDAESLSDMFRQIDTDASGTVSFTEWVEALVEIRKMTHQREKEERKAAYLEVLRLAETAFDEGDADWSGEFDLQEFVQAFRSNPRFVQKVSLATGVPPHDYAALGDDDLVELFDALDTDFSGTLSFDEFVTGLIEINLAKKEEEDNEPPQCTKKTKAGPKPYILPLEVQQLQPLSEAQKVEFSKAFAQHSETGWGFDCCAKNVSKLLQELYLVVDESAAQKYIDRTFPQRDLSVGLQETDCEALYKVALQAQVWSRPLATNHSQKTKTVKDMQEQERSLRQVFARQAGAGDGAMHEKEVAKFLVDTGVTDNAGYTPRILDRFHANRKPGPVRFPEVAQLCNTAISSVLSRYEGQPSSPLKLEPLYKPSGGSPAVSLRHKRLHRTNWASQGQLVLKSGLGKSSSTSRLGW